MVNTQCPNFFVKKGEILTYYNLQLLLNKTMISYKRHLHFRFGDCGQTSLVKKPKRYDNGGRTIECSYRFPSLALQGGHGIIDIKYRRVLIRSEFDKCKMTPLIIC